MSPQVEEQHASVNGEGNLGMNANAKASGEAQASQKTERRTPKKLGGSKGLQETPPTPPQEISDDAKGGASPQQEDTPRDDPDQPALQRQSRPQSRRRQSRGRGRKPADSDTESVARSDVSAQGGRRQRQRAKKQAKGSQGGPLGDISEGLPGAELVNGAGDMVQDTAGKAVGQVGDTAGKALGGLTGGKGDKKGGDDGGGEQLRLRLELNLDIEIQLKAKIHGDLTLGLLN